MHAFADVDRLSTRTYNHVSMICPSCSAPLEAATAFCGVCGYWLVSFAGETQDPLATTPDANRRDPSITSMVNARVAAHDVYASNLVVGARYAAEAERASSDEIARSQRLDALRHFTQAVERAFYKRLFSQFTPKRRAEWVRTRERKHIAKDAPKLDSFLRAGEAPSLMILGLWLRKAMPKPDVLAAEISSVCGASPRTVDALSLFGGLRIVLAHMTEYEQQPDAKFPEGVERVFTAELRADGTQRLNVDATTLAWLEDLSSDLIGSL